MATAKTDEQREKDAEERSIKLRAKRIGLVLGSLDSKKNPKTVRQIAAETGLSSRLVGSTIRMVRTITDDHPGEPVGYDPSTHTYWVTKAYTDTKSWTLWATKYLATRSANFAKAVDVIAARYGDDAPPELMLVIHQMKLLVGLQEDLILEMEAEARGERAGKKKAKRPVKLHG